MNAVNKSNVLHSHAKMASFREYFAIIYQNDRPENSSDSKLLRCSHTIFRLEPSQAARKFIPLESSENWCVYERFAGSGFPVLEEAWIPASARNSMEWNKFESIFPVSSLTRHGE